MGGNEPQRACESLGDGIRQTFLGFITMAPNPAAPKPKQAPNQTNKTLGRQEMLSLSSDSESEDENSPLQSTAADTTMAPRNDRTDTAGRASPLPPQAATAAGSSAAFLTAAPAKYISPWVARKSENYCSPAASRAHRIDTLLLSRTNVTENISEKAYWTSLKYNWDMIIGTPEATNAVGTAENHGKTRLQSVNGVPTKEINLRDGLQPIFNGLKLSITGLSRKKKLELCDELVAYKDLEKSSFHLSDDDDASLVDATLTAVSEQQPKTAARKATFNFTRLINAAGSEEMKKEWTNKGAKYKSRQGMEIKHADPFFKTLTREYNSANAEYDRSDKYSTAGFTGLQTLQEAKRFVPLTEKQIITAFTNLNSDYKRSVTNCQKSGNHDDFYKYVGTKPYLLYYHNFLEEAGTTADVDPEIHC